MATYKRRIVYLSDEEWTSLRAEAGARRQTVSSLVRDRLRDLRTDPPAAERRSSISRKPAARQPAAPMAEPLPQAAVMTQAQRDAVLRKVNRPAR